MDGSFKEVRWVGSSRRDMARLPTAVRGTFGFALFQAQQGGKHVSAKPLKGFGSGQVLEIVDDDRSGTYRAAYTVRFGDCVYVLHVFQKKSRSGVTTPRLEIDLIRSRYADAEEHYHGQQP